MSALEKGDLSVFCARDRVALEFAERLTRDSNHIPDELFAELGQHFDEGQIVEVGAVAGIFNYFNRFNNAFQMEPTR